MQTLVYRLEDALLFVKMSKVVKYKSYVLNKKALHGFLTDGSLRVPTLPLCNSFLRLLPKQNNYLT